MQGLNTVCSVIGTLIAIIYSYQILYYIVSLISEIKERRQVFIAMKNGESLEKVYDPDTCKNRYAFLIAARNEEAVIGNLIKSIKAQSYPSELVEIFVMADNCTDNTAEAAVKAGASVYKRYNRNLIGKGYAIEALIENIRSEYGRFDAFDGYLIFDADNVLDRNYLIAMDEVFSRGHCVVTGYRNSKNYNTNWITSGYSMSFLREAQYLNRPRRILNASCTVSGTGFLFSHTLLEENDGWAYKLLTEDIELSADCIVKGKKIAYAPDAMFYDEQPETFRQSWNQRIRWAKGFYQVIFRYGKGLLKNLFKDKSMFLARYDMFMFLAPSMLLNILTVFLTVLALCISVVSPNVSQDAMNDSWHLLIFGIGGYYLMNFIQGLITTITEWNNIIAPSHKKILYLFTFPIFILTYIPISFVAIFSSVQWKPIKHNVTATLEELEKSRA